MEGNNTSLDQLHDIFTPAPIGWEYNEGQVIVIIFAMSLLLSLSYLLYEYRRKNLYKYEAIKELKKAQSAIEIFELIKRVLLSTKPRKEVAHLSQEKLLEYIGLEHDVQLLELSHASYNPHIDYKSETLHKAKERVLRWIREYKA